MTIPDLVNGTFEASAGVFVLNHCRCVIRDRQVKGVSILSTVFFTAWGVWNLWFYPWLGQWMSFFGGLFVVSANTFWVVLMLMYRNRGKEGNHDGDIDPG